MLKNFWNLKTLGWKLIFETFIWTYSTVLPMVVLMVLDTNLSWLTRLTRVLDIWISSLLSWNQHLSQTQSVKDQPTVKWTEMIITTLMSTIQISILTEMLLRSRSTMILLTPAPAGQTLSAPITTSAGTPCTQQALMTGKTAKQTLLSHPSPITILERTSDSIFESFIISAKGKNKIFITWRI